MILTVVLLQVKTGASFMGHADKRQVMFMLPKILVTSQLPAIQLPTDVTRDH
jgi:Holliday junction resolvasome RuvABC endonuclease subunit